ncbi:MAG: superoxide dismutase [Bdellovibrionales bacterium RIFCSPHIGHO2_01_FULL_40_29]|nr:MAG: superoxide dismutase [Bdellovibrionales bacterium RIFCSPHIGHO2_01_FULL_40_29]OFZ35073.1 MAG: superoxide dismutase [Bdellovibrionales bacterium RIFCSPHIGHO2_02_FULL_40_15]
MFKLPQLPFAKTDLAPLFNEEQMNYHYDKHHKAYIDNLNKFLETDASLKGKTLEEIVLSSTGGIFNNAAQAWNHTFYWFNMQPLAKGGTPAPELQDAIKRDFGSMDELKAKFVDGGMKTFGSGWIWLCTDAAGKLSLVSTSNAAVPFTGNGPIPLMVADVWEHAYYVDYRNARQKYLETFWGQINWTFVSENFAAKKVRDLTKSMI